MYVAKTVKYLPRPQPKLESPKEQTKSKNDSSYTISKDNKDTYTPADKENEPYKQPINLERKHKPRKQKTIEMPLEKQPTIPSSKRKGKRVVMEKTKK